jgi:recombinational DNA repair protein (RecF pathway)
LCLAIHPWSRTSHVVSWLTPFGPVKTVVKGAVRPKSVFLGQYDLNYTCEIVYYLRERGNLHALRECVPRNFRENLRSRFRALALAGYMRTLVEQLVAGGADSQAWYNLLEGYLDLLSEESVEMPLLEIMVGFDMAAMRLYGIAPDFSGYNRFEPWSNFSLSSGSFEEDDAGRKIRIARKTAQWLSNTSESKDMQILLDAARVIGVFYQFHLDYAAESRREVLKLILHNDNEKVTRR